MIHLRAVDLASLGAAAVVAILGGCDSGGSRLRRRPRSGQPEEASEAVESRDGTVVTGPEEEVKAGPAVGSSRPVPDGGTPAAAEAPEPVEAAPPLRVRSILRNGSFEGSTRYWPEGGDVVTDSPGHGRHCVRLREKGDLRSASIRIDRDCHAHEISVTAVLCHNIPKWARGRGDKLCREMEAWAKDDPRWKDLSVDTPWDRFVRALVKRYGHEGIVYELANEPDIGKWDRDDYANFARRTYRVIKGVDPKALVQANVTWPGVSGWTQEFVKRGGLDSFDCHTFHNYTTGHLAGPGAISELRTFFKSFGAQAKEIWFNEGWTYYPTSEDFPAFPIVDVSAPAAAHMVTQTAAQLLGDGMEKLITFHVGYAQHGKSWWDWVGSGTEWWDDVGNPTVAVAAYNTIADQLGLSDPVGTVRPEGAVIYVFEDRRHGRGVAVAWAAKGRDALLGLPLAGLVKVDCVGNASPVKAAAGKSALALRADGKPYYVYSTAGLSGADLVADFKGMHQAGTFTLKDFVVRKVR
ncbi:MAG: glycoside hydrolase family 5 protein [Planctomycetota bacterium]|jgi:hypothetical protein